MPLLRVVTTFDAGVEARQSPSALAGLTETLLGSLDLRNMMTTWSAQYHPIPLGRMEREKTLGRCEGNNHEQQKSERDTKIFCKASDMARAKWNSSLLRLSFGDSCSEPPEVARAPRCIRGHYREISEAASGTDA